MDETSEGGLWSVIKNFFTGRSENTIENLITEAKKNNELGPAIAKLLLNVLMLDQRQVREIMVPRTDIDCVEENASFEEVVKVILENGHSRVPVFINNKDHIKGILHAKDLLQAPSQSPRSLNSLMREPFFVPDTKNIKDMLFDFQDKKVHMAIAIDEYGGTSGLLTLEDVLEEIVGEIEDEYDTPKPAEIKVLDDDSCLVSGRTSLEDLEFELGIFLESENVETIGGYLTENAGHVPQKGEVFTIQDHSFQIREADTKQCFWIVVHPVQIKNQDETEQ